MNLYLFTCQSANKSKLHDKKVHQYKRRRSRDLVIFFGIPSLQTHLSEGPMANMPITHIHVTDLTTLLAHVSRVPEVCPERVFTVHTCIYTEHTTNLLSRSNPSMAEKACVQRLQKEFRALCKVSSLSPLKLSFLHYIEIQLGGPQSRLFLVMRDCDMGCILQEPVAQVVARPAPENILEWRKLSVCFVRSIRLQLLNQMVRRARVSSTAVFSVMCVVRAPIESVPMVAGFTRRLRSRGKSGHALQLRFLLWENQVSPRMSFQTPFYLHPHAKRTLRHEQENLHEHERL